MILNKGLKKTYVQNSQSCYFNRIHPSNTFSVLVSAQGDFGDLEAAKQITEVCGQMAVTLPLIWKKSVVVLSTQLSKHKRMVPLKVHSTDIWPNKQIKYLDVILDRNCSRVYT